MVLQLIKKNSLIFLIMIFFLCFASSLVYSKDIKTIKILINPFSFNTDENSDLTFLKKGIDRMLHTRLTHINKTKIIFNHSKKEPIAAAKEFSADYVLTGSITMYGSKISTDASLFSLKTNSEVLTFSDFGDTKGDAIRHINELAAKINIDILGIMPLSKAPQMASQQSHPRDYNDIKTQQYGSPKAFKFQSRPIKKLIRSISIGDIDGDKTNEIIYITKTALYIVAFKNKQEILIAKTRLSGFCTPLRVDTIDINHDTKDEIIVTCSNDKNLTNNSIAFKFDNKTKTLKKIPIYENAFYSIYIKNNEKILIAQKRSKKEKIFKGNIFKAEMIDGAIELTDTTMHKPRKANIYTFISGDLFNNGNVVYPVYDKEGFVNIFDQGNTEIWRTTDYFGSTPVSFLRDNKIVRLNDEQDKFFIWGRMYIADLNHDNKKELILVHNQLNSSKLLNRTRTYRNGHISILAWDEDTDTLKRAWASRPHSGYIVDCIIGDMNNDGKDEIIYAVVPKFKNLAGFMREQQTYIFARGF